MTRYFSRIGAFIGNLSPERERRELRFADDKKKRREEPERERLILPTNEEMERQRIDEISASMRLQSQVAVPELSEGIESVVIANGRILADIAVDAGIASEEHALNAAKHRRIVLQTATPEDPNSWQSSDKQEIIRELLRTPETTLELAKAVENKIKRYDDHVLMVESKMKAVFSLPDGAVPLERFAKAMEGLVVDRDAVERTLQLPSLPPDAPAAQRKERADIVHLVIETLAEYRKKQTFGQHARLIESPDLPETEQEQRWRTQYYRILQESQTAVTEHLRLQLEQRVNDFADAEAQREHDLLLSLGVRPEDLDGQTKQARNEISERACLRVHGVTLSRVLGDLHKRGKAVQRMHEAVQSPSANVTAEATALLQAIKDFEKENDRFDPQNEGRLAELRMEQEGAERWAERFAGRLKNALGAGATERAELQPLLAMAFHTEDPWKRLEELNGNFGKYADAADPATLRGDFPACITPETFTQEERDSLEAGILMVEQRQMGILLCCGTQGAEYETRLKHAPPLETIIQNQLSVRRKIEALIPKVLSAMQDVPVCSHLNLPRTVQERASKIEERMMRAVAQAERIREGREPVDSIGKVQEDWVQVMMETEQLETLECSLSALTLENAAYDPDDAFPGKKSGFYSYADKRIHLRANLQQSGQEKQLRQKWLHEKGHAILHTLRDSGFCPFLLVSEEGENLAGRTTANGETFEALLERLAPYYLEEELQQEFRDMAQEQFPTDFSLAARRLQELRREFILEELFSRYADWVVSGTALMAILPEDPERLAKEAEQELFAMIHNIPGAVPKRREMPARSVPRKGRMFADGDEFGPDADSSGEENPESMPSAPPARTERGGTESEESSLIKNALKEIDTYIKNIDSFFDAYRKTDKSNVLIFMEQRRSQVANFHESLKGYERRFRAQERLELSEIDALKKKTKDIMDEVKGFDREFWDISKERKAEEPGFWDRVRLMSILDVVKLWKNTMEDFKTIWGRNQERLLQDVGNVLTDALVKGGGKIPIAGSRYFAKLRGYHERRYGQSELESVGKWKTAMEKWDTHSVLHRLAVSQNLDEIRGCIELVCDRGEMDWNDMGIWKTLEKTSGFKMPKDACLRDDILRDTWLRRMISETWNDKELYYKWRSANDSKTESEKQKHIQTVDQYSNVSDGLSGNLERQLHLYTVWTNARDEREKVGLSPPPFPDDVKPHLYEEVIEYSIKNGKMSMEEKMYYIVQGVASGLLPIERLRAMAGQHGSIINLFPYIEYFYAHNNSLPEIRALGKRLTEHDNSGKPTFSPGLRTSLWIHFEVSRDEQVRRRLSKGSTRKAEDIDHEDIPWFVTQMDYSEMSNMLDVISGGRQKVTPEGLKNAYVGFNSKMKIFGNLAKLEGDKLERFTEEDAKMAAKNLAAYILMDNTLTMNGKQESKKPPTLALSQFKTQAVSGVDGTVAWDYRHNMTTFIRALNDAGIFDKNIQWGGNPAEDRAQLGVSKEAMFALKKEDKEEEAREGYQRNKKEDYDRILSESVFPRFAEQLEQAILKNLPTFKRVLADCEGMFLNEGGSKDLDYEKVKPIKEEQERLARTA